MQGGCLCGGDLGRSLPAGAAAVRQNCSGLLRCADHQSLCWLRYQCGWRSSRCTCPLILAPALIPAPIAPPALPQKRLQRRDGTMMTLAQSKRASELQKDMNAWEENRLMTSGGAGQSPSALWR